MKIKWGVIGCGGIADLRTIPGMLLAENAELVAVMDTNMAKSVEVKEKYGAKYAFSTLEELLEVDEIQAIYIATPVFCHKEQVFKVAAAKKHILLEKPVGLSIEESIQIAEECKKQGVKLGVGFMMRFHTYHQAIKEIIARGDIGEIVAARAVFATWYPKVDKAWRQSKELSGGGAMLDMGIHCVDLLRYITGMEVVDATGMVGNVLFDYEVEEGGNVLMRMENGAICTVEANFNVPDDDAVCCRMEFFGSNGSIFAEGTVSQVEGGTVQVRKCDKNENWLNSEEREVISVEVLNKELGNMYTKEIACFGNAILNDSDFLISAEDAIASQKVIEAAYISNNERKHVKL